MCGIEQADCLNYLTGKEGWTLRPCRVPQCLLLSCWSYGFRCLAKRENGGLCGTSVWVRRVWHEECPRTETLILYIESGCGLAMPNVITLEINLGGILHGSSSVTLHRPSSRVRWPECEGACFVQVIAQLRHQPCLLLSHFWKVLCNIAM